MIHFLCMKSIEKDNKEGMEGPRKKVNYNKQKFYPGLQQKFQKFI